MIDPGSSAVLAVGAGDLIVDSVDPGIRQQYQRGADEKTICAMPPNKRSCAMSQTKIQHAGELAEQLGAQARETHGDLCAVYTALNE